MGQDLADSIWRRMVEAEIRSLYFADLAAWYTKRKQIATTVSFILSSAAAATVLGNGPKGAVAAAAIIIAILNGYSISVGLDTKAIKMSRLHAAWNRLSDDYNHLWLNWYDGDATEEFGRLIERGRELSETATTEAPYDRKAMDKWSEHVASLYAPTTTT